MNSSHLYRFTDLQIYSFDALFQSLIGRNLNTNFTVNCGTRDHGLSIISGESNHSAIIVNRLLVKEHVVSDPLKASSVEIVALRVEFTDS